jgi:hypothetical protein
MSEQRGSTAGRTLWIILGVVVALLVGGDIALRSVAEARVEASVQRALGLPREPDIDLQGFPFTLHLIRGRITEVDVQAIDLDAEGLEVERAVFDFRDVRFPRRALLFGGGGTISVDGGRGEAEISDLALTEFLGTNGVPFEVRFLGPKLQVSGDAGASARGRLRLDDGVLSFRPEEPSGESLSFRVQLPELLPGLSYRHLSVGEGTAVVSADLAGTHFELVD